MSSRWLDDRGRDTRWLDDSRSRLHTSERCSNCGSGPLWESERHGGGTTCFRCRYGKDGLFVGPIMGMFGDGSHPMDFDPYANDDCAILPSREFRESVDAQLCRGFCVECKAPMNRAERLASLACPKCVEKLGTDEAVGRWDGKPEPSEDVKKGAA